MTHGSLTRAETPICERVEEPEAYKAALNIKSLLPDSLECQWERHELLDALYVNHHSFFLSQIDVRVTKDSFQGESANHVNYFLSQVKIGVLLTFFNIGLNALYSVKSDITKKFV